MYNLSCALFLKKIIRGVKFNDKINYIYYIIVVSRVVRFIKSIINKGILIKNNNKYWINIYKIKIIWDQKNYKWEIYFDIFTMKIIIIKIFNNNLSYPLDKKKKKKRKPQQLH